MSTFRETPHFVDGRDIHGVEWVVTVETPADAEDVKPGELRICVDEPVMRVTTVDANRIGVFLSRMSGVRSDADRLRFLIRSDAIFDSIVGNKKDRHEHAFDIARENGGAEPTEDEEMDGLRRCIDEAMDREEQGR